MFAGRYQLWFSLGLLSAGARIGTPCAGARVGRGPRHGCMASTDRRSSTSATAL